MKRYIVLLMVAALAASLFAPTADAKKKKKPKPVPVAVDQTYYIVWNEDACALSTATTLASKDDACADPFAGAAGAELGTGPFAMAALDGLPITLDATKPIKGKISTESFIAANEAPVVMGIGQAQLSVKLVGTSGGEEIVIGELTTDPYTVTPATQDYVVEFEITPAAELQGKVFEGLTLNLELKGNQMFHGVLLADGTSTLTLGAFSLAK
ncbi:MAG: hypothetical protein QOG04_225 [Actinomycetota bacterium]|jgi:hypothetical protein|nr:hypothetical protein [Actinomycetota bacterium]